MGVEFILFFKSIIHCHISQQQNNKKENDRPQQTDTPYRPASHREQHHRASARTHRRGYSGPPRFGSIHWSHRRGRNDIQRDVLAVRIPPHGNERHDITGSRTAQPHRGSTLACQVGGSGSGGGIGDDTAAGAIEADGTQRDAALCGSERVCRSLFRHSDMGRPGNALSL